MAAVIGAARCAELRERIRQRWPGAEVEMIPHPDGARLTITTGGTLHQMKVTEDGPLLRFLLTGKLGPS